MSRAFSIYLDLVRFVAAFLVYVYHSNQRLLSTEVLPASWYGHSAVIVFFVLSGFVIAFVTDTKERHWVHYAASRISRIYSVALPAVVLTLVLDAVGRQFYPALYEGYPFDQKLVRTAASLLLLNEWWFVSITSFSNVPYWSICYESWYYIAFAVLAFAPRRKAWLAVAGMSALMGPKFLLLAPVWAAGVVLYRWRALRGLSVPVAAALFAGSVVGIVLYHAAGVQAMGTAFLKATLGPQWTRELAFSQYFLTDYLLALLVFCNFAGMRVLAERYGGALLLVERPVRAAAGLTLTLYLLHQPLFLFWAAVIRGNPAGYGYWWAITAATGVSVVLIAHFTESRRHGLRRWVEAALWRVNAGFGGKRHVVAQ